MTRARLLVVDDKENMRKLFEKMLGDVYALTCASDGQKALALIATQPFDVVLCDIRMPGADGFEVLAAVKSCAPDTEVVMMTAYATVADAVLAMKQGAFDYLQKPFDPDAVSAVLAAALARQRERTSKAEARPASAGRQAYHNLLGQSAVMGEVYRLLEQAAGVDSTVLITGETGTGKELAARAVHYQSARKERRFVPVNCGALPTDLVESELFGHARGAFTGADAVKRGLFEEASGGTIFLDEIGELPLATQVKLNRALADKEIRRVGETTARQVDVRVVVATHRELLAEAAAGRFREDLFYRLNVFPIRLPALRERRDDVLLLAEHFLDKHSRAVRRVLSGFDPDAAAALVAYDWPGNVRELENVVERAAVVAKGPLVAVTDLPVGLRQAATVTAGAPAARTESSGASVTPRAAGAPPPSELGPVLAGLPYREALDRGRERVSREYLEALLLQFSGNVTRAAEHAGLERESLHRLLKRHGLRADDFRG